MQVSPRLRIEGVRELNRLLRRVGGRDLQKQLGQVHRRVGEMVIARAGGSATGVGTGAGATIRPSAATREVILRVGGSHRDARRDQWGRQSRWPGGLPPFRPHLIGAAKEIEREITREYLSGVETVIRRAGLR